MDFMNIDTYAKAKIAIYYYSELGNVQQIEDILNIPQFKYTSIGLGFAIYIASKKGMIDVVKFFNNWIKKRYHTIDTYTFLSGSGVENIVMPAACYSGNLNLVEFLMDEKIELTILCLNKVCKIKDKDTRTKMLYWIMDKIKDSDIDYETCLINLLKLNDTDNVLYILNMVSIEKIKPVIINLFRFTAYKNNHIIFNWLYDNFNICDCLHTVIICAHYFIQKKNYDLFEKLVNCEKILSDPSVVDFLSNASYNKLGVESFPHIYFKCGLDIDYLDYRIIRCCAESGNIKLMRELITENETRFCLNINENKKWRMCLEHCFRSACCYNYIEIAQWLLELGIDPNNQQDYDCDYAEYENSLILAAHNDNVEIIEWLLNLDIHTQEIINDAIYETLCFSKRATCVNMLLAKTTSIDHKKMYIGAVLNNIDVALMVYEKYQNILDEIDFTIDDFKSGDFFFFDDKIINHLEKYHPQIQHIYTKETLSLSFIKKNISTLMSYASHIEILNNEYCNYNTYYTILDMSLYEIQDYFFSRDITSYNNFHNGLKNWIIFELGLKLEKKLTTISDIEDLITKIMAGYSHISNRHDFDYEYSRCIERFYMREYPDVKLYQEKIENIKMISFCDRFGLKLNYIKIFDYTKLYTNVLIKNKIPVEYVIEDATKYFNNYSINDLNWIRYLFHNFHFETFPEFDYTYENLDKIKFLLNYFEDYVFFEDYDRLNNANIVVIKYLLENTQLQIAKYVKLSKNIFKIYYGYNGAVEIINIIFAKSFMCKKILDGSLKSAINEYDINFLDYLIKMGATISNNIKINNASRYGLVKKMTWLNSKSFNCRNLSKDVVSLLVNRLNYKRISKLLEIGCEIEDEAVIYWYVTSSDYENKIDELNSLIQMTNNKFLMICRLYFIAFCNDRDDENYEKFKKNLEDFEFSDLAFFKFIVFFHNVGNNCICDDLLEIIKEKYPRVTFIETNGYLDFRISNIKSAKI